jgi:hypothetical protein
MKTFSYLWQYVAEFFVEWEMFQINFAEKNSKSKAVPLQAWTGPWEIR